MSTKNHHKLESMRMDGVLKVNFIHVKREKVPNLIIISNNINKIIL